MKVVSAVALVVFGVFSSWVMLQVGYMGIWTGALDNPGSQQVLADLVVACGLICIWMVVDAKERGGNAWPFVAVTLVAGSFGPLFYLLMRPALQKSPQ